MRGWGTKCEWEETGRGAGNEFRVKWSLRVGQRSSVRSVSASWCEIVHFLHKSKNSKHPSILNSFDLPMLGSLSVLLKHDIACHNIHRSQRAIEDLGPVIEK